MSFYLISANECDRNLLWRVCLGLTVVCVRSRRLWVRTCHISLERIWTLFEHVFNLMIMSPGVFWESLHESRCRLWGSFGRGWINPTKSFEIYMLDNNDTVYTLPHFFHFVKWGTVYFILSSDTRGLNWVWINIVRLNEFSRVLMRLETVYFD